MKYFLDTEFNEDGRTIDLISIGIVCDDGREFYAVNQEAELHRVNDWVRANVLPHLPKYGDPAWMTRAQINAGIRNFVGPHAKGVTSGPEFWAYYADYDWVALCQLFGAMVKLPDYFPKYCNDLKQLAVSKGVAELPQMTTGEHDALNDARWNRDMYAYLTEDRSSQATGGKP